ncbi:MAG TPA: hydrogenase maturation protease [Gammaproteobacteria bacterium]
MPRPLLIAAGNRWRRDDGAGPLLVERLAARLGDRVDVRYLSGEGAGVIDAWQGRDEVWLFDAAAPAGVPGRVTRIETRREPVPATLCHHSTHRFGVAEAIEMARALDQLPRRLVLVAIEGGDFGEGKGLSTKVAAAAGELVDALAVEICSP